MGGLCAAESSAFVVTRRSLSVAMAGTWFDSYLGLYRTDTGRSAGSFPSPGALRAWEQRTIDVSAACGRSVALSWTAAGDPDAEYAIDDLTLEGPACEAYLDLDGDGACPAGTDI